MAMMVWKLHYRNYFRWYSSMSVFNIRYLWFYYQLILPCAILNLIETKSSDDSYKNNERSEEILHSKNVILWKKYDNIKFDSFHLLLKPSQRVDLATSDIEE